MGIRWRLALLLLQRGFHVPVQRFSFICSGSLAVNDASPSFELEAVDDPPIYGSISVFTLIEHPITSLGFEAMTFKLVVAAPMLKLSRPSLTPLNCE